MIRFTEEDRLLEPLAQEGAQAGTAAAFASQEKDVEYYRLPGVGTYTWIEPLKGVYGTWGPLNGRDHSIRQWWFPNAVDSLYQFGAPLIATYGYDGENRTTAALSDSVKKARLSVCVDDLSQRDEIIFKVELFDDGAWQQENGEVILRIDRRPVAYYDAVRDAGAWMRGFLGRTAPVPEGAVQPLYSSWYNFHQEPQQELLLRELEAAAKIGFRTVILDDGWQFEGKCTGDYYKCGDWAVAADKFPDFKAFADAVHRLGMKLMMWFPVPFAGYATEEYRRLRDKIAFNVDGMRAGVLDVRYPYIREHIIGIYERFVKEYGIDGLKLDFVDAFRADPSAVAPFDPAMDYRSLDKATRRLMRDIYTRLTAKHPDFLFEFRQNYIGAEIVSNCNMLRVGDCAADPVTNRVGIAAIRLVNAATAPHSDMLLWGRAETPENCMRQMLNIMFSVPQISVLLTEIPEAQAAAVRRFVNYWSDNRDVLLGGVFRAPEPGGNYALLSSETADRKITVLYETSTAELTHPCEDIWNCTDKPFFAAVTDGTDGYRYKVFDWRGVAVRTGSIPAGSTAARIQVPSGGMAQFERTAPREAEAL